MRVRQTRAHAPQEHTPIRLQLLYRLLLCLVHRLRVGKTRGRAQWAGAVLRKSCGRIGCARAIWDPSQAPQHAEQTYTDISEYFRCECCRSCAAGSSIVSSAQRPQLRATLAAWLRNANISTHHWKINTFCNAFAFLRSGNGWAATHRGAVKQQARKHDVTLDAPATATETSNYTFTVLMCLLPGHTTCAGVQARDTAQR